MKRFTCIFLVLSLMLSIVGCSNQATVPNSSETETKEPETKKPESVETAIKFTEGKGKVAVITSALSQNEEEYRSAQEMVQKYGEDKIIHVIWPENFMAEQEQMISMVSKLGDDPEVKAIVFNQAVQGTNAAVDKLLEVRDDIYLVYVGPQENPPDVASRADLVLESDGLQQGYDIPEQAKKLGAKTLVHYSFPRHMSVVILSAKRERMREKCAEIGLTFVDATAPDPMGDAGISGAQQFILEDVPKMVAEYGKDTAFYATNCSMQIPLIKSCIDQGAIYPQPCCPSPFHGFPTALGIESKEQTKDSVKDVIAQITEKLREKGVLGRFSTYPIPVGMMQTVVSIEYAIKWMDGEVGDELDVDVLEKLMQDYAGVKVKTNSYTETVNGSEVEYKNIRLTTMDYLTFGE